MVDFPAAFIHPLPWIAVTQGGSWKWVSTLVAFSRPPTKGGLWHLGTLTHDHKLPLSNVVGTGDCWSREDNDPLSNKVLSKNCPCCREPAQEIVLLGSI